MKNKFIMIFKIISSLIILFLVLIILYEKTNIFSSYIQKKDLTKQKYRKTYVISNDLDIFNHINDEKTLVIFWATWCPYCIKESDALNEYITSNPYKSVIVVTHDTEIEELKQYLEEKEYNWFVIFDPNKTIREVIEPGSKGIPSSYLLKKDGTILNFHKGSLSVEQFQSFFNEVEI